MKKKHYNTLRGLLRACAPHYVFTLSDYITGTAYLNNRWARFTLSPGLEKEVLDLFAAAVWEKPGNKARKLRGLKDKGILRRVMIVKEGGEFRGSYCAGQDHVAKIKYIQGLINRQYRNY